MIITFGALYVILPALFALACMGLAWLLQFTPVEDEEDFTMYTMMRDYAAKRAVQCLDMYKLTDSMVWYEAAMYYYSRAQAYNNATA